MKRILLAVAEVIVAAPCWPQNNVVTPASRDAKPASTNAPGREYPNVDSQRRATFRIYAPDAKTIRVFNTDLKTDDDGYWTGTTQHLGPVSTTTRLRMNGRQIHVVATGPCSVPNSSHSRYRKNRPITAYVYGEFVLTGQPGVNTPTVLVRSQSSCAAFVIRWIS